MLAKSPSIRSLIISAYLASTFLVAIAFSKPWTGESAREQLVPKEPVLIPSGKPSQWPSLIGDSSANSSSNGPTPTHNVWQSPKVVQSQPWYIEMTKYALSVPSNLHGQDNMNSKSKKRKSSNDNQDQISRKRSNNNNYQCSNDYNVKYFLMSLQWPPGFCTTSPEKCIKEPELFTLHGMWAQIMEEGKRSSPEFCCFDNTFDANVIKSLDQDLNYYWPSLYGPGLSFWRHEWLKHGTCARDTKNLRGEYNYFATTLALLKSLSLKEILAKSGITPSSTRSYYLSDVIGAVKRLSQNKAVQILCEKQHDSNIPVLSGINICYDNNLKFFDCPRVRNRCGTSQVMLPKALHGDKTQRG